MQTLVLTCLALSLPLLAADTPRVFPLWDGKETVERYAARVNLPPTKSIDLGGGVKLDLVLIPAGQFIMGSPEPEKPNVSKLAASWLIALGGGIAQAMLLDLLINYFRKRKRSFSLRWLMLLTMATGVCIGGIARFSLALTEAARYETEMAEYNGLPANEKPAHSVTLTQPFYMGKHPITQAQYQAVAGRNPSHFNGTQLPVQEVRWYDASDFCAMLNKRLPASGLDIQLPTEAQWEYACRAGGHTKFYCGNQYSDLDEVAWHLGNSGYVPHPVGTKTPNMFGLHDMHGNVWQWCRDAGVGPYINLPQTDPLYNDGQSVVLRGGSFMDSPGDCRSALRNNGAPGYRVGTAGFRVVVLWSPIQAR